MTKKEERKLIKIFGINPGLVVRDAWADIDECERIMEAAKRL